MPKSRESIAITSAQPSSPTQEAFLLRERTKGPTPHCFSRSTARADRVLEKGLKNSPVFLSGRNRSGRAGGIRTHDLLNPIQAFYQAELRPDEER